jgi:hypothetical protein
VKRKRQCPLALATMSEERLLTKKQEGAKRKIKREKVRDKLRGKY